MLTLDQLRMISPQLAAFVSQSDRLGTRTLLAAFQGTGGLFAAYRVDDPLALGKRTLVCTLRERPVPVEIDGLSFGMDTDTATSLARALASGLIAATPRGATLVVSEDDADRAFDAG